MKEREQWKKYLLLRKNTIFGKNSASEKCFKVDFFFFFYGRVNDRKAMWDL